MKQVVMHEWQVGDEKTRVMVLVTEGEARITVASEYMMNSCSIWDDGEASLKKQDAVDLMLALQGAIDVVEKWQHEVFVEQVDIIRAASRSCDAEVECEVWDDC